MNENDHRWSSDDQYIIPSAITFFWEIEFFIILLYLNLIIVTRVLTPRFVNITGTIGSSLCLKFYNDYFKAYVCINVFFSLYTRQRQNT